MATKRPSKAEIRRRIKQAQAPAPPPPPLTPEIAEYVDSYIPRGEVGRVWADIQPFVLDALRRYEPTALESARQRLVALAAFATWANERDYPLQRSTLLTFERIEAFAATAGLGATTTTNYRSRLRGIARKVNPHGAGPTASVSVAHRAVKAPYTPAEVAAIVRIARTQPSAITGRQLCACVGLGLGGGLDSEDIKPLLGRHVIEHVETGIEVRVPGPRPRTVWIRREYEDLVRVGLEGVAPDSLVTGQNADRRNVAAKVFEQAHILGDAPHFEQSRMRTTWLATLLVAGLPLPVIMDAAGLSSARTLTDLVPLLHADTVDAAPALLRGDG